MPDISIEAIRASLMEDLLRATQVKSQPKDAASFAQVLQPFAGTEVASKTDLTPLVQQVVNLIEQAVTLPAQRGPIVQHLASTLRQMPQVLPAVLSFLTVLKKQPDVEPAVIAQAVELTDLITMTANNRVPVLNTIAQAGPTQQAAQMIAMVSSIVEAQRTLPPQVALPTSEVLSFLSEVIRTNPDTFENETFATQVLQRVGIGLPEYVPMANDVEPLRLALLVITATRKPRELELLVNSLTQAVREGTSTLPIVERFEARLHPQLPIEVPANNPRLHLPGIGTITLREGSGDVVLAQAISRQEGVLSDSSWQVTVDDRDLSIMGSLLPLSALTAGLHHLKLRVREAKGSGSVAKLIVYVLGADEAEPAEESLASEEKEERAQALARYTDAVTIAPPVPEAVEGEISFALNAPVILMTPYDRERTVPAPLQARFHFLVDFVSHATRFSRESFLTFSQSQEAASFRRAVDELATRGIEAVERDARSLERLFARLTQALPAQASILARARSFLQQEVLLYLMGKRSLDGMHAAPPQVLKMIEASPEGDVIASIAATAAGLSFLAHGAGDALICLRDAVHFAETKEHYLGLIGRYFDTLRGAAKDYSDQRTRAASNLWANEVPVYPPQATDHTYAEDNESYHDAKTFVQHLRIEA